MFHFRSNPKVRLEIKGVRQGTFSDSKPSQWSPRKKRIIPYLQFLKENYVAKDVIWWNPRFDPSISHLMFMYSFFHRRRAQPGQKSEELLKFARFPPLIPISQPGETQMNCFGDFQPPVRSRTFSSSLVLPRVKIPRRGQTNSTDTLQCWSENFADTPTVPELNNFFRDKMSSEDKNILDLRKDEECSSDESVQSRDFYDILRDQEKNDPTPREHSGYSSSSDSVFSDASLPEFSGDKIASRDSQTTESILKQPAESPISSSNEVLSLNEKTVTLIPLEPERLLQYEKIQQDSWTDVRAESEHSPVAIVVIFCFKFYIFFSLNTLINYFRSKRKCNTSCLMSNRRLLLIECCNCILTDAILPNLFLNLKNLVLY